MVEQRGLVRAEQRLIETACRILDGLLDMPNDVTVEAVWEASGRTPLIPTPF